MAMAHQAAPKGVRVSVTDGAGRPRHLPGLSGWLRAVAPARACGAVSIALVGDAAMRRLNRRFAGKDRATDVLSFPSGEIGGVLGDIAIATGVARRRAREAGHTYREELRVLALHGLLHLLGYDHHGDDGLMARIESRLRRKGGLRAGLIERARP
jgi:probable rRNA maturation factor